MYKLYYAPGRANLAPHMLLEELGVPYELVQVDLDRGENRSADYRRLNPVAKVPVLIHGDIVLSESAAICLYLVDRHPDGGLGPRVDQPSRAQLYRWLLYLSNTVQPELMIYHYPERYVDDVDLAQGVRRGAESKLQELFRIIDDALADGPYLLGRSVSVCDFYLLMLARWTRSFERPVRLLPNVGRCLELVAARSKIIAAFQAEGITPPFC